MSQIISIEALLQMRLNEVERFIIEKSLEKHNNNITETAKSLGIARATLYRKLHEYGFARLAEKAES